MSKRSLYECAHARVKGERIICDLGYRLPNITIDALARGAPLICKVCQQCPHFSRMGKPLARMDRGWTGGLR